MGEDQLVYVLETRFAPHLEAAAGTVREAEGDLGRARERLARAEEAAAGAEYSSDPLIFMRRSVEEELDGLDRKTNEKRVRTSYRFLLDRAVDLAAGEVQGYHDDQAEQQRERERGVQASREAEVRAREALEEARQMLERVQRAESLARQGLDAMAEKLESSPGPGASS